MYGCFPSLFFLSVHLSLVKRAEAGSEQRLSSALYRLVKLSRATRSNLTQTIQYKHGQMASWEGLLTTDRLGLFAPFLTDPASSWLLSWSHDLVLNICRMLIQIYQIKILTYLISLSFKLSFALLFGLILSWRTQPLKYQICFTFKFILLLLVFTVFIPIITLNKLQKLIHFLGCLIFLIAV